MRTISLILPFILYVSTMVSVITINAQGLRQNNRRQTAFSFFKRHKYDIILLQETHWTDELEAEIRNDWGHDILLSNGTANARGTAMLFNPRLDYNLQKVNKDCNGRIISALIEIDNYEINIVNIYAPCTDVERRQFYLELDKYISTDHENIVAGDSNLPLTQYDRMEGSMPARQTARTELYRLMTKHELVDIWRQRNPHKRVFTWTRTDSTTNKSIGTRIDRILIDKHLDNNVTKVDIIPYQHSDHDATTIIIDVVKLKRGAGYWHFNNKLLTDAQFTQDITTFWADWTAQKANYDNPLTWWDKAKYRFKQIAINHSIRRSRADKLKRTELERKVTQLQNVANSTGSSEDTVKYLEARNELKQFDLSELEAIKIRTKVEYTEQGEKSTRYFYSLQKRRQAEQNIKILTKDNNESCTEQQDILKEVHAFYKQLYTSEEIIETSQEKIFNVDCPTLSEEAKNSCEGYITLPELQKALTDMEPNKSPGLDGLTSNFYKHFWNLIGKDLADIYNYGFEHELLSLTQRRGVITLLFKKNDKTKKLASYHPIND